MNIAQQLGKHTIFQYLFLGACFSYSFVLIFYGIDFTDTFYNLNILKDFKLHPLTILTSLVGRFWMKLFGNNLLSFRILNFLLLNLAVSIPFFFLIPKEQKKDNLIFLGIVIVLLTTCISNIFNSDSVTFFLISISSVSIIKYLEKGGKLYIVIYGLSSTLLILARFPNVIILPIFMVIFFLFSFQKNKRFSEFSLMKYFRIIAIYFIVSIGIYIVIINFIYGDLKVFYNNLSKTLSITNSSHEIKIIIKNYLVDLIKIIQYSSVLILIYVIGLKISTQSRLIKISFIILAFLIFSIFLKYEIGLNKYNWNLSLLYSAICYSFLLNYGYSSYKKNKNGLIIILMILGFSILPAMGSNTGLIKTSPFLLSFLPVLFCWNKRVNPLNSKIFSPLIILLVFFAIYVRMKTVYEDSSIIGLNCKLKNESLQHIHTTSTRCTFIENVLTEVGIARNETDPILFYGRISHLFYYLTNIRPLYQNSFWMLPDDSNELQLVGDILSNYKPIVFLLIDYPGEANNNPQQVSINTKIETLLLSKGYTVSIKSSFKVFFPSMIIPK